MSTSEWMRFSVFLLAVAPLIRDRWLLGKHITCMERYKGGGQLAGKREEGRDLRSVLLHRSSSRKRRRTGDCRREHTT